MENPYPNGKIIIASNRNVDPVFEKTVVYVHSDDEDGAIGVIINCPMEEGMAERFSNDIGWQFPEKIGLGGPQDRQIGYVLHSNEYAKSNTVRLNAVMSYTGGKNIVYDVNRGTGPQSFLLLTGYCSWAPYQLIDEIDRGIWTVADFDENFFFQDLTQETYWEYAVNLAAENKTKEILDSVDIK